jgi:hypothetical protein
MEFVGILLLFAPLGALIYYVRRTSPPGPGILTTLGIVVAAPPAAVAEEPVLPQQAETSDQAEIQAEAEVEEDVPKRMIL